MTNKATQRKIATLEAQLEALKADREKLFRIYSDTLAELVEWKMRAEEAARVLRGEV